MSCIQEEAHIIRSTVGDILRSLTAIFTCLNIRSKKETVSLNHTSMVRFIEHLQLLIMSQYLVTGLLSNVTTFDPSLLSVSCSSFCRNPAKMKTRHPHFKALFSALAVTCKNSLQSSLFQPLIYETCKNVSLKPWKRNLYV